MTVLHGFVNARQFAQSAEIEDSLECVGYGRVIVDAVNEALMNATGAVWGETETMKISLLEVKYMQI